MKTFRALVAILLCCFTASCSRAPQPTPLFDGFMSYTSWEQLKADQKLAGFKWEVLENSNLPSRNAGAKMHNRRMQTSHYSYLGFKGYASFRFCNNRLMSVEFEPQTDYIARK